MPAATMKRTEWIALVLCSLLAMSFVRLLETTDNPVDPFAPAPVTSEVHP